MKSLAFVLVVFGLSFNLAHAGALRYQGVTGTHADGEVADAINSEDSRAAGGASGAGDGVVVASEDRGQLATDPEFLKKVRKLESARERNQPELKKAAMVSLISYMGINVLAALIDNEYLDKTAGAWNALQVADFLTAFAHWMEDTYFSEQTPWIGEIIAENRLHHEMPGKMTENSFWESTQVSAGLAVALGGALMLFADPSWYPFILEVGVIGALTNQIHKFNHMPSSEVPWWIKPFQGWLIQGRAEHKVHHTLTDRNYCVLGTHMNYVLENIGFWRGVERSIEALTGVPPRLDEIEMMKAKANSKNFGSCEEMDSKIEN